MVTETSDLQVIQDLVDAGVLDAGDVVETRASKDRDGQITADDRGRLSGGDGDDTYIGEDGVAEVFFFDGRDDGNDEGRHVDVVQNFELGSDNWQFRLDGRFFEGLEQTTLNSNQAAFSTARDFADLMLELNGRTGIDRGSDFSFKNQNKEIETIDRIDDSGVEVVEVRDDRGRVVREHIVFTFDDTDFKEDHVDRRGNFKTDDLTIVFEDFAGTLAATFANELGFAEEFESRADSVHIADALEGGNISGGDGDNLFILSRNADNVQIDDRNTGNDEAEHVNIIHGFDLTEDSISGRFDGGFFDGSNQARFEGAAGLLELLNFAETVGDSTGDLVFTLQSVGGGGARDPLTFVFTDTTVADVAESARDQIFDALIEADVIEAEDVVESSQDGIIFDADNNDGDDLILGSGADDRFFFDSRDGNNDEPEHVDVIVGFDSNDSLGFRIDGGFFEGFEFRTLNDNQATVGFDDIDSLGEFLNAKDGENAAFFDDETNSTVLVLDDSPADDLPSTADDELYIVLWNTGDLL